MSLIDYFNAFQVVSASKGLTANTRSLYFAILGEFNKQRYPSSLKLENTYLQHLSGISSTHSFDSARNALINAELVRYKKQVYHLPPLGNSAEISRKEYGNSTEISRKGSIVLPFCPNNTEKDREQETDLTTTATSARTREFLSENSEEVKKAWFLAEGESLKGYNALDLIQLENQYGTQQLVEIIHEASRANTKPRLSYNFLEAILQNRLKGGKNNVRAGTTPISPSKYQIDICPND